jgi:Flp pilus assembly protein TadD
VPRHRLRSTTVAVIAATALGLSGCASADDTEPEDGATTSATPTESGSSSSTEPTPAGVVVEITFDGDSVTPNGERVDAKVGEPVTLEIDADAAGELHVHSTPEQEIAYDAGTSTHKVTFDQPGVVDIESHDLEKIVVQVEVR